MGLISTDDGSYGTFFHRLRDEIVAVHEFALDREEELPRLNGAGVDGISLRCSLGIKLTSSGEKIGNARERQLHEFFPAAAASQMYPASRKTWRAISTSSNGMDPWRVTCTFS